MTTDPQLMATTTSKIPATSFMALLSTMTSKKFQSTTATRTTAAPSVASSDAATSTKGNQLTANLIIQVQLINLITCNVYLVEYTNMLSLSSTEPVKTTAPQPTTGMIPATNFMTLLSKTTPVKSSNTTATRITAAPSAALSDTPISTKGN